MRPLLVQGLLLGLAYAAGMTAGAVAGSTVAAAARLISAEPGQAAHAIT